MARCGCPNCSAPPPAPLGYSYFYAPPPPVLYLSPPQYHPVPNAVFYPVPVGVPIYVVPAQQHGRPPVLPKRSVQNSEIRPKHSVQISEIRPEEDEQKRPTAKVPHAPNVKKRALDAPPEGEGRPARHRAESWL